jgi:hypothetical protein
MVWRAVEDSELLLNPRRYLGNGSVIKGKVDNGIAFWGFYLPVEVGKKLLDYTRCFNKIHVREINWIWLVRLQRSSRPWKLPTMLKRICIFKCLRSALIKRVITDP